MLQVVPGSPRHGRGGAGITGAAGTAGRCFWPKRELELCLGLSSEEEERKEMEGRRELIRAEDAPQGELAVGGVVGGGREQVSDAVACAGERRPRGGRRTGAGGPPVSGAATGLSGAVDLGSGG